MRVLVDDKGTVDSFQKIIDEALEPGDAKSLLIMSCDGNNYIAEELDPILNTIPIPVFGGIFPVVLHDKIQLERGNVIVLMDQPSELHYIPGLSDPDEDYEDVLDNTIGDNDDIKTLILFVDGLSTRIAAFIDALYAIFGLELNYVGGGAGSLTLIQKPCIITNEGLQVDGGILAAFPMKSGVGVSHGWKTVSGPYKVTESERNIVKALDWRPALEVYREVVKDHCDACFNTSPFFDIAKAYPFGIARMGSERIVRDILTITDKNHLACVAEVPEGEYVDILHSNANDLIVAAGQAFEKAKFSYQSEVPAMQLFMDCISRVLFLQERFSDEIDAVTRIDIPMVGACTIGEIANSGNDYLEFYNKTSVVAFLENK